MNTLKYLYNYKFKIPTSTHWQEKAIDIKMKLLFVALLATWTVRILSCRTVIQNGKLIRQFVERHAEKTMEESLKFKLQEMERLKTEIEELEEQKTDET